MKKGIIQNYGTTIIIFGAMIGVGYYLWKSHKEGIEKDIEENFK